MTANFIGRITAEAQNKDIQIGEQSVYEEPETDVLCQSD
jgi:hypothetical protein